METSIDSGIKNNGTLKAFKKYHSLGWKAVPSDPQDADHHTKKPSVKWKHLQTDYTYTVAEAEQYYRKNPLMGVGILTQGLLIIDLDGPATEFWADAETHGLPPTPQVCSTPRDQNPKGDWDKIHLHFRLPPDTNIRNSVGSDRDFWPDVDIRADGGFSALPPTRHYLGHYYKWVDGTWTEDQWPIAPDWLIKKLKSAKKPKKSKTTAESSTHTDLLQGVDSNRDNRCRDIVWYLLRHFPSMTDGTLLQILLNWNATNQPPWGDKPGDTPSAVEWAQAKITRARTILVVEPEFQEINIVDAEDIEPKESEWLWPGRYEFGEVVALGGDPGLGKSIQCLAIAVAGATGGRFPTGETAPSFNSWIITFEDDPEKTLANRLISLGYNNNGSIKITDGLMEPEGLGSIEQIETTIRNKDIRFLAIDPVNSLMAICRAGDKDKGKNVRPFVMDLMRLARRTNCCIVLLAHMNKAEFNNAIYRFSGALEWVSAPRCALSVWRDEDDPTKSFLAPLKVNNSAKPETVAYTIRSGATNQLVDLPF